MSFLSDNFASVASGADLTTSTGAAWTKGVGGNAGSILGDASGRVYPGGSIAWYVDKVHLPAAADYTVAMGLTWLSQLSGFGPAARMTDASGGGVSNGYCARYRAFHGFELCRVDSGSFTVLGSISASEPTVNGQAVTLSVQVSGTSITGTVSGAVSGTVTVTDATYAAAGYAGMAASAVGGATTGIHATSITGTDAAGAADTTPPVVSSASVNAAGTTLTIAFTETGSPPVLPATGATGFALTASGGAVTLSSPAISGTTYTATTSRAIQSGETITLAYTPGNVTDSATTPNALASFSGTAVTNNSTQSGTAATAYTLTGPSGGLVGSASTNFTVQSNGSLAAGVTVTPSDNGKLGSFTPTSVTLASGTNTSATFTYTPKYYGAITISATNSGTLADPSGVTYTTTLPSGGAAYSRARVANQ